MHLSLDILYERSQDSIWWVQLAYKYNSNIYVPNTFDENRSIYLFSLHKIDLSKYFNWMFGFQVAMQAIELLHTFWITTLMAHAMIKHG